MATIEVSRLVDASRDRIHAFLADVRFHSLLSDRGLQLIVATDSADGSRATGLIRVNPPGPVEETVSTVMTSRDGPSTVAGVALIRSRKVADIVWSLDVRGAATLVRLSATTGDLSARERVLLVVGGRWWIRRRFGKVLERLDRAVCR
jgi:hypothetical protein